MSVNQERRGAEPPIADLDPFSMEFLSRPFDHYRQLRESAAVVRIPKYDIYAVLRYEEVKEALTDWRRFESGSGTGLGNINKGDAWRARSGIVEVDPPEHTQVRAALMKILSPIVVRGWREKFNREADALVARLASGGCFDAVKDLVEPFIIDVFPDALGIDEDGRENLLVFGEMTSNGFGPLNELTKASMAKAEPLMPWFTARFRRDTMLPGGFGEKLWQAAEAGEFSVGEMPSILATFLRGGMDTVISGIANTLWLLATNPEQWQALRRQPSLARASFDEAIRLESPAQSIFRTTITGTELGGYHLSAGTKVLCSIGSANRDPRHWIEPDRYDIARNSISHLALGTGVHVCIGQMIARAEAEAILGALLKLDKNIELSAPMERAISNNGRRIASLPVRLVS